MQSVHTSEPAQVATKIRNGIARLIDILRGVKSGLFVIGITNKGLIVTLTPEALIQISKPIGWERRTVCYPDLEEFEQSKTDPYKILLWYRFLKRPKNPAEASILERIKDVFDQFFKTTE